MSMYIFMSVYVCMYVLCIMLNEYLQLCLEKNILKSCEALEETSINVKFLRSDFMDQGHRPITECLPGMCHKGLGLLLSVCLSVCPPILGKV